MSGNGFLRFAVTSYHLDVFSKTPKYNNSFEGGWLCTVPPNSS